ncbi:M28 family metallopeptidase [Croceicoccus sp. Ery5]|uniref:M28 family metallopeptidase n=1 Tax=Croceicoccus sp. Ery5 TaxID=1703340 RepID=UPI001E2EDE6F|nr:M28 family metallopeptidase [Croceicoccus sp. Ery5]
MRKLILAAALAGCAFSPVAAHGQTAPSSATLSPAERSDPAAAAISADEIAATVTFLADDLLQGRDTGSEYYDIAAAYVASRYRAMGLEPANNGSWMQDIIFRNASTSSSALTITTPDGEMVLEPGKDFVAGGSFTDRQVDLTAPMVFVGQGIHSPENGIDDYAGVDIAGKIVVIVSGAPKTVSGEVAATLANTKTKYASENGAVGMISIRNKESLERLPFDKLVTYLQEPRETWVGPDGQANVQDPGLKLQAYISPETAARLMTASGKDLDALLKIYDDPKAKSRPAAFDMTGEAKASVTTDWDDKTSANVVAMLPGSDPALAGEYVVMSAHLDHVGNHLSDAEEGEDTDTIYNGAMDNATGVATMLEVARVIAHSPHRPRRPILFAALTAEEKGLLGSEYLARHFVREDGKPVGVVNFDMPVLLYDLADVVGFGAENSTMGQTLIKAGAATGIGVSPDFMPEENLFTRSDHYSFVKEGVPALFLMTGVQNGGKAAFTEFLSTNYHQPTDDLTQPLNWESARKFALLNYEIVKITANADEAPKWYEGNYFGENFAPDAPKAPAPGSSVAAE